MTSTANWRSLYPFASHELRIDGRRYHYVDEGAGSPVLMVHGNPTWSFYWRRLVSAVSDRRRAIAVDHLGCGLSDKPSGYDYCLDRHIDNLSTLVERLDLQNATLAAHDWGGAIGLGAVLRAPERFKRIVLLNTGAFPPPYVPWRILACRLPVLGRFALKGLNLFARAALTMAVEHRERMTPEVRAGLLAPYDSWAHREAIWQFVRDIPLSTRRATWQTLARIEAGLPGLADRPVLLGWGLRDWCFTVECLRRFQAAFPRAETAEYADAGHYVLEDAHERLVPRIVEFLDAHPVGSERTAVGS